MRRKKILITIDWFLPGTNSGGPVRSYANLIDHLDEGYEFLILTRNTDFGSIIPYDSIIPDRWTYFNDYTKVFYCSKEFLTRSNLKKLLAETQFDLAYINGIYSWYFSILPVLLIKNKPVMVSARGMLNPQAFSVKKLKKKTFLKLANRIGLYKNVRFHATNINEADCVQELIVAHKGVSIAPNLPRKLSNNHKTQPSKDNPVRFVNMARISVEKGTLHVLYAFRTVEEDSVLDLYGPIYDNEYWKTCEEVIATLPPHLKVNYLGILKSDDVPHTLCQYDFFVLLSEGENFGHAILEALSVGLPVIISDQTPWRDLEQKLVGWDVDLNDPKAISKALDSAVTMSNEDYKEWSDAAYSFAQDVIDNPEVVVQNKALFKD